MVVAQWPTEAEVAERELIGEHLEAALILLDLRLVDGRLVSILL